MKQEDFLNMLKRAIKCPRKPAYQNIDSTSEEYYQSMIQEKHLSKQIEVILKENVITSLEDNLFFRFNNYSNTGLGYAADENFILEIKKEDNWYVVPMNKIDMDETLFIFGVGKSNPTKYFEIDLKKYFNHLENGHYRMLFRICHLADPSQFIFYKPYEDLLCTEEFDILVENENNDKK